MSVTDSFAPLMTTDNCLDPSAVVGTGLLIAACMVVLFVNCGAGFKNGFRSRPESKEEVMGYTVWRMIAIAGLIAIQISAFVSYRGWLGHYGFAGYIFPRDVFAIPLSCICFVFVAMDLILSTGIFMRNRYLSEDKRVVYERTKVRHAIYYFHYTFWAAFYILGGAMTYRSYLYLSANTANDGTYPDNFEVLCILILAISVVTVISLAQMFSNVYETGKFNELVGATQFHGFLGIQTSFMEMEFPFIVGTCFYTGAIYALIYKDIYQFQALGTFVVFFSLLATFLSKNLGTFAFYFAFANWVATTISYVATDAAASVMSGNDPAQWGNPGANIGLPQLNISEVITATSFPTTLNLLTGMSFASLMAFGFTAMFAYASMRTQSNFAI